MLKHAICLLTLALLCGCTSGPKKETYAEGVIRRNAKVRNTGSDLNLRNIAKALEDYHADNGNYPVCGDYTQLEPMLSPEHIRILPARDAWGYRYRYSSDGTTYRLASVGYDGREGTADDIVISSGE
ncbi:MAG: type II secretion system protein GspG [Acidobacteriota bacterium]